MNTPIAKTKVKRPSKGMRKYNRKMKQEARKANITVAELKRQTR